MDSKPSSSFAPCGKAGFVVMALCLAVLLGVLFYGTFEPGHAVFSNDGPVGVLMAKYNRLPAGFLGAWQDLNSIGQRLGGAWPSVTWGLLTALGPIGYAKFYAPFGLLLLGLGAWCFLRQMGLRPLACILGGLAATLNSVFFSTACWGVVAHPITIGLSLFAMAALADLSSPRRWLRVALAGVAVGCAVGDGADVGGILAIFVAAYAMYQAVAAKSGRFEGLLLGAGRVAIVAACAVLFAAQAVVVLFGTQVQGVVTANNKNTLEGWDRATQWSLPKRELLSELVPGLFGYRMETPNGLPEYLQHAYTGGQYWGAAGRDPVWDRYYRAAAGGTLQAGTLVNITFPGHADLNTTEAVGPDGKLLLAKVGAVQAKGLTTNELSAEVSRLYAAKSPGQPVNVSLREPNPQAEFLRYSGGGPYSGVLVILVALWAAAQALRKGDSAFNLEQRKALWFWLAAAVLALLLAFGRYAPFYQFIYPLPFFSSIRNPAKFLLILNLALVVLFGYGMHALSQLKFGRGGSEPAPNSGGASSKRTPVVPAFAPPRPSAYDKAWMKGSFIALGIAVLAWLVYAYNRPAFEQYLTTVGFDEPAAHGIAGFSLGQVGWFLLFLSATVILFTMALAGKLAGPRARMAGVLFGVLLVADLGRANLPYILFVDYAYKNEVSATDPNKSSNPVVEFLQQQPYEHRVTLAPYNLGVFGDIYRIDWMQHQFQYFDIQCLDIVQMPRAAEDFAAYHSAISWDGVPEHIYRLARYWQLTNTRYILGPAAAVDNLNQQFDPIGRSFRIGTRFDLGYKPGVTQPQGADDITAVMNPNGKLAVIEYQGALPRAKLYTHWQVTKDQEALTQLAAPNFDPQQTLLVANPIPAATATTNGPGTVTFVRYACKDIVLKSDATAASVLLLNDRYDPNWHVTVDGLPAPLLRCNYIMRGVQVPVGSHQVEFRFQPPVYMLYVSLLGTLLGLVLSGYLLFGPAPATETEAGASSGTKGNEPAKIDGRELKPKVEKASAQK
ncbi:MAG TPA: polysaccharide biosynthesis/export family protein [Verrucomicrobiae bacterium]|nr:polysaccharide biosynthesis/export family protein [Verrucomicrobiae bacterium]